MVDSSGTSEQSSCELKLSEILEVSNHELSLSHSLDADSNSSSCPHSLGLVESINVLLFYTISLSLTLVHRDTSIQTYILLTCLC